jgi:polyketide cyclase/dehydrase/lipid transport protein
MKNRIELEIDGRQADVAELFADPRNNPRWMDDIDRIEPVSGEIGQVGSVYRIVPKRGTLTFVAKVVTRSLPVELALCLEARRVSVAVIDRFVPLSDGKTKLISEETFTFNGLIGNVIGFMARRSIAAAHRRHMESFKRFAESRV